MCDYDRIEGKDEKENHQRRISIRENGREIGLCNLVYWNVWNPPTQVESTWFSCVNSDERGGI